MSYMGSIVLQKEIDKSLLTEKFTLTRDSVKVFGFNKDGKYLQPGESKYITIFLNGNPYSVLLKNVNYSIESRKSHPNDALQVCYSKNSEFAKTLRTIFSSSYEYIKTELMLRKEQGNRDKGLIRLPDEMKEYLVIYNTSNEDTYIAESLLANDMLNMKRYFGNYSELQLESMLAGNMTDPNAGIEERRMLKKIRKIDGKISEYLKQLYGYRCQICGQLVGGLYDTHACESHHIDYFSKSWNNDASNQMILCPNHHKIIHSVDPIFNRKKLQFEFKNGYYEGLMLNNHLGI